MGKNGGKFMDCITNIIDGHERLAYRFTIDTGGKKRASLMEEKT